MSENFVKFERNEDKYIISGVQADRIRREVARRLRPSYPNPLTKYTLISSVYLDSPELLYYRNYLNRATDRIKIRIRKYGNDGVWNNNDKYLELKENEQGEPNRKSRLRLFADDSTDFIKGATKAFMDRVAKRITDDNLKPIASITYRREAFSDAKGFRVTFDENIDFSREAEVIHPEGIDWNQAIHFGEKYNPSIDMVMEVKHNGEPKWFKELITAEGIKPTPFSKYAYAIYEILKRKT